MAVEVVGVGARTPLGLRAAPAAAAVRAGLSAATLHPFLIDQAGDRMAAALDAVIDPALLGWRRMLPIAESALREACEPLRGPPSRRVPLFLSLPEDRPGFGADDADSIAAALMRLTDLPGRVAEVGLVGRGHAGGLAALSAAASAIARGEADCCLAGGVASYFEPDTMEWLDANRQLAGSVSRSAFVPGEGAGFCLLTTRDLRDRLGVGARARILGGAMVREDRPLRSARISLGAGMTAAVGEALTRSGVPRIDDVYCDLNGERYRSEEWGFLNLRLGAGLARAGDCVSPAACWGDLDAASGPLLVMLACQAFERRYAAGPNALVFSGSESGLRGALVLGAPTVDTH